ncbi:hypothetical protein AAC387_Pa12g0671 [Persea americana]
MPPEIHLDPLPIIDDSEPHRQALANTPTAQGASSLSVPIGLGDGQDGGSQKEECIITKQDIPNNAPAVPASSGPSTPMISTSETKNNQQNTPPEDVLVITISDMSSGSDGDHHVEFEEAPDILPISSSYSFITETYEVITLEDEPTDPGSEPEVTSCQWLLV